MKQEQAYKTRVIDLLNKLAEDGSLDALVLTGVVSSKVIGFREMFLQYDINRRVKNMSSMTARWSVAVQMNCDISTVHKAIRFMSGEVCPQAKRKSSGVLSS